MRIEKSSDSCALAIATIVMGIIAGASSGLLSIVLDATERVFFHFTEPNAIPVAFSATPLNRLLAPIIGALIVSVVWYFMQLHYRPVKLGKAVDGEKMPMGATIMHVTAQVFYVGTGGSIGRELAPREAGAMWAQSWIRLGDRIGWLKLAPEDRRLLIAAAAGAGFAGVYIAPITGAMFCLEILYKKIDKKAVIVSLTMAAIATMVGAIVKGWQPYYLVASRQFSLRLIPFVVIVAPLMGFLGTWYKRLIGRASALRVKDRRIFITMPLAGALTGAVACFFPEIMGNGRGVAQMAINVTSVSHSAVALLLFGFFAKGLVTLATISGGGYGGTLTPSIAMGSSLGVLLGMIFIQAMPGEPLMQFAVLGAAFFLAATQQAPLMAMFMLFEVCHLNFSALLPLGLGVALSMAISSWMQAKKA